jgi:hypothetical protein
VKFRPSRQHRKAFGQIAEEYDLVYFGSVVGGDDEYKVVRGLTASTDQKDENYTVGDVHEYPIVFFERHREVKRPDGHGGNYHWTILSIELKHTYLPHIFVDGVRRDHHFYGQLLAGYLRLPQVNPRHFPDSSEASFNTNFTVYAQPDAVSTIEQIFRPDITGMLAAHFRQFDFEMYDSQLIVYSTDNNVNLELLDQMLRAGVWLARHLDGQTVTTPKEIAEGADHVVADESDD